MREKVILVCTECLSRNYSVYKNNRTNVKRLELRKYCKKCGKRRYIENRNKEAASMDDKARKEKLKQERKELRKSKKIRTSKTFRRTRR